MRVKIHLFPYYVSLESASIHGAEDVFRALKAGGAEVIRESWHGTLESLPTDGPAIIRASSMQTCSLPDLIRRCKELGHLVFYDNGLLDVQQEDLMPTIAEFLTRVIDHEVA